MDTLHLAARLPGVSLMMSSILCILFTPASCKVSLGFTLGPLTLDENFDLQSLNPSSKYPFPSPQGAIFLTQDPSDSEHDPTLYNVGRITYIQPLRRFKDEPSRFFSFTSSFTFQIKTFTKYNESGDGIAFVLTTDKKLPTNSTGRFLGLMPENLQDRQQRYMAVEFDTFQNLQEEIMDPSASHIGIDVSSLSSLKPICNTANPMHSLYLYNNYTITAWVSYNASTHLIQVWATNTTINFQRPSEPILSITHNLSQVFENYTDVYIGITAASGRNSQANILYSWNFTIVDNIGTPTPRWHLPLIIVCLSSILLLILQGNV